MKGVRRVDKKVSVSKVCDILEQQVEEIKTQFRPLEDQLIKLIDARKGDPVLVRHQNGYMNLGKLQGKVSLSDVSIYPLSVGIPVDHPYTFKKTRYYNGKPESVITVIPGSFVTIDERKMERFLEEFAERGFDFKKYLKN